MEERIQKLMAQAGIGSRRECEKLIADGRVTVNGRRAKLGNKANPATDTIVVNGRTIQPQTTELTLCRPAQTQRRHLLIGG